MIYDMKTLSNSELTIKVSPHGAELCSILHDGKEYLSGRQTPLSGNGILRCFFPLQVAFGRMNTATKAFPMH